MFLVPIVVGVAGFVDGLATGVWATKKWGTKAVVVAAVENAAERAVTIPSGGLKTIAAEVVDDVKAVADKVTGVVSSTAATADTVVAGAASLQKLLAAAHVTK